MTLLYYVGLTIIFLWTFWAIYVLVMGLYRAHLNKKLSTAAYVLGAPWLALGVVIDAFANATIATIFFLDPPRELLVTARLQRYARIERDHWRKACAEWICTHLLDIFDPNGDHC